MIGIPQCARAVLASAFLVLGVLVVLALAPVRAGAEVESLRLDPGKGPPGTSVIWHVGGVAGCGVDDGSNGVVVLLWDGTQVLDRVEVSPEGGSADSTFLVPESAELGVHRVTASCLAGGEVTADSEFTVTAPQVVKVAVPNVIGFSEGRARARLEREKLAVEVIGAGEEVQVQDPPADTAVDPGSLVRIELGDAPVDTVAVPYLIGLGLDAARKKIVDAGLEVGGVSGDRAGRVTDQSPGADAEVLPGVRVSISLAPVTPPLVVVPDLVGKALNGVSGILVGRGLTLGLVSGDVNATSVTVLSQEPPANSKVARNSAVNVSVESAVPPPRLVKVPSVVGENADAARSRLAALGLKPAGSEDSSGEVTNQQPAAGTLVPVGTAVSLVLEPQSPRAGLVAGLVILGAAALAAHGPLSRSLDRRWVRTHLDIQPAARAHEAGADVADDASSPPTRVVRVVPRSDPGTHVLEEVRQ